MNSRRAGHIIKFMVGSWLSAIILASPLAYFSNVTNLNSLQCTEKTSDVLTQKLKLAYSVAAMVFQYVFPLIIVTSAYTRIGIRIRRSERLMHASKSFPSGSIYFSYPAASETCRAQKELFEKTRTLCEIDQRQNEASADIEVSHLPAETVDTNTIHRYRKSAPGLKSRRTIILLAAISIIFALSWLPTTVSNLIADVKQLTLIEERWLQEYGIARNFFLFHMLCLSLILSSACLNPVMYGWLNEKFRHEFYRIFRINRGKQNKSNTGRVYVTEYQPQNMFSLNNLHKRRTQSTPNVAREVSVRFDDEELVHNDKFLPTNSLLFSKSYSKYQPRRKQNALSNSKFCYFKKEISTPSDGMPQNIEPIPSDTPMMNEQYDIIPEEDRDYSNTPSEISSI